MKPDNYPAACDCPEIQDEWEPKVGDGYWSERDGISVLFKDMITLGNIVGRLKHDCIYLPSTGQLLTMLGDTLPWLDSSSGEGWEAGYDGEEFTGDTPQLALIQAYMHMTHGKTLGEKGWE